MLILLHSNNHHILLHLEEPESYLDTQPSSQTFGSLSEENLQQIIENLWLICSTKVDWYYSLIIKPRVCIYIYIL